jgi:hypothetical protein
VSSARQAWCSIVGAPPYERVPPKSRSSFHPGRRSTPEPASESAADTPSSQSPRTDSNRGPLPYHGSALPAELRGRWPERSGSRRNRPDRPLGGRSPGEWRDQDSNLGRLSREIYSLVPLTARVSRQGPGESSDVSEIANDKPRSISHSAYFGQRHEHFDLTVDEPRRGQLLAALALPPWVSFDLNWSRHDQNIRSGSDGRWVGSPRCQVTAFRHSP